MTLENVPGGGRVHANLIFCYFPFKKDTGIVKQRDLDNHRIIIGIRMYANNVLLLLGYGRKPDASSCIARYSKICLLQICIAPRQDRADLLVVFVIKELR